MRLADKFPDLSTRDMESLLPSIKTVIGWEGMQPLNAVDIKKRYALWKTKSEHIRGDNSLTAFLGKDVDTSKAAERLLESDPDKLDKFRTYIEHTISSIHIDFGND